MFTRKFAFEIKDRHPLTLPHLSRLYGINLKYTYKLIFIFKEKLF